jgi:hypothetical protein
MDSFDQGASAAYRSAACPAGWPGLDADAYGSFQGDVRFAEFRGHLTCLRRWFRGLQAGLERPSTTWMVMFLNTLQDT